MKCFLDTHVFLWYVEDSPALSQATLKVINDGTNEIFLSHASVWEIAIKYNLGKLELKLNGQSFQGFIEAQIFDNRIELLPIRLSHIALVSQLSQHHRDPFDRLLVAQAQAENLTLISADTALDAYEIQRLW